MKLRIGACALVLALAGCSGESPESGVAGMRGVAATGSSNALKASLPTTRAIGTSIANAPDRGALISFANKGKPTKKEGAYTWYPVAISEAHAFQGLASGEMNVPTPDGGQVKVRYERHAEEIDGNWTWIGRVVGGDPLQEAIITFGEKAVFGSIPMGNGKLPLSLQTRQGQVFAVEADPSLVVSANTGHVDMLVPEASHLRAMAGATASQAAAVSQGAVAVSQNAPQTAANTIDVAIGYTPEFAADNGGASGAATRLVYLVQVGNQAFTNSQINGYLRIVNAVQVSYTNSTANSTALNEVTGSNGSAQVAVPASLVPLRTARDQYGADIAILVRKFTTPENAGCGIAWLNGAGAQTGVRASDAPFGYAVISDGYDQGTDGRTYYCADETLVHEAGHLMGAAHDRANSKIVDNQPPGGTNLRYGAYTYSFGLNTDAANGNFYTLDAYGDEAGGDTPYRVFSNPNVTICGGRACGVANSEDNARTLNQTIPVVAAFRATVVPFEGALNLKVIAKLGSSATTEVHDLNGSTQYSSYLSNRTTALYRSGSDNAWVFQFGDFNKDSTLDLYAISKNGASGRTEVHVMNGASGYGNYLINIATALPRSGSDSAWVFRLGDFNRDGTLDLYVIQRNGGSGRTEIHVLNGANNFQSYLINVATALHSTGSADDWNFELGDFNKDGTLDIFAIKKNGATSTEVHVLNGANSYQSFLINLATVLPRTGSDQGWIFKLGDYDGDGTLDIFAIARMGDSGKTELHVMGGAGNYQSFLAHIATTLGRTGVAGDWAFELTK